ncbi:molybdenum cofactor cytidylyltransferase [Cytobacillus oceanisediminis]|jgi:molybdenum cofactor cytidylyltransferase|uniref:Molybdenum cofactor cytidylyltransferase n=1 Tax=Cytobacillus oceanisediminis TaxID=665099 RepID=A0A2V2ZNB2_9BACI|nr:nucleotidyltransferase family protein [Cytobacillus oceanisediminis]PWW25797.1 molybdenum cofactor cytidylyltransferase [Cytobacillus oceanisediminis]
MAGAAILLAGGQSTRMGELKGLLSWHGRTLFEYQLQTLIESPFSDVIAVVGYRSEELETMAKNYPVKVVKNDLFHTGKCSSIIAGVSAANTHARNILITAVDQPASELTLKRLYNVQIRERSLITVPVFQGRRGHPVLFSSGLREELSAIKEETKGLRSVFQKHKSLVKEVPVDDSSIHLNLNTPEDYLHALKIK